MKKGFLLKSMLLLFALIVGIGSTWGQTYEQLTSIANIDESADYVLGIDGTGFHYDGTSSWGLTALPSAQTPIYYKLKKASDGNSFTAEATISNTKYYLQIPTSNTFSMATSTGTNTDIIIGTTQVSGTNYAVANKTTTTRHLRINGTSGLRSYAGTTGTMAFFYKVIPAFTLTAVSNNTSWGTVSVSGNKITANPATGYRISTTTPYSVTSGTATVEQNENVFTVTASAACTVCINFEAIPTYTVTFDAEDGSCGTSSLTESLGGQGVTLPSATIGVAGWVFAGWAESAISKTTTIPTLYLAGSKYYPTAATTLHAVYMLVETGSSFVRVTDEAQVELAKSVVVVYNANSYVLDHSRSTQVAAPTETSGEITPTTNTIFTLGGNNTDGFTLTGANGTLSQTTVSTSSSNDRATDWSGNNNQWKIEENANAANTFALSNSPNVALEYYNGWKTEYSTSYNNRSYTAMRLYIPKNCYNSNPSAIIEPSVAFDNGNDGTTLYLDGTKTYTNAAHVTGVSKTINYTSSNTSVATVTSSGLVTAVGIGTATITASVEAELGVSSPASATYVITVKSATTIAGLKALTSSSAVDFSADLTDAVVTYVNGSHAYIQDNTGAVYASCGTNLTAGQKINGAVSGSIKAAYQIDEITLLDVSEATVTTDGDIPAAVTDKTLEQIKSAGTDYDGKLVTINGATVTTGMTNTTSGGKISDDNGTTTFNIIAPNKLTLVANEKGNFTGFVSIYVSGSNTTYRLNIYEEGQFVKTHNAPTAQTLTFASDAVELDEDTEDYTSFDGQQVSGAKGTVSYALTSDENNIITSLNAETGAVVLSGAFGTATVTATAAAIELTEGGVITPYTATTKSYTVSVYPRYSATFSINGVETTLREATHDAGVTVPTPTAAEPYMFVGWSTAEVAETNTKPATVSMGATLTLTADNNGSKYYALYAQAGELQNYTLTYDEIKDNTGWGSYGTSYNYNQASGVTWVIKAYKPTQSPYGMQINTGKNSSIKVPDCPGTIQTVEVTGGASKSVGFSSFDYTGSGTITYLAAGIDATSQTLDLTNESVTTGYVVPKGGNIQITQVKVNFRSFSGYTTSLPNVDVKIGQYKWATFCYNRALDFTDTGVSAYIVTGSEGESTITKEPVTKVPANTGLLLKAEQGTYSIPVTAEETDDVTANKLVPVLTGSVTVNAGTEGNVNYVLTVKSGQVVFAWVSSSYSPVVTAGKAYLTLLNGPMPGSDTGAPWLSIEGDEGTTGVQNIERTINDNQYYTLDGRRVGTPTKGLYIINGKKVVVK